MSTKIPSTRRDTRFALRLGTSTIRFADPRSAGTLTVGSVMSIGAAGFAFQVTGAPSGFPNNTAFEEISLRIGSFVIEGEAVVRNIRELPGERVEVGCLFYPDTREEDRWATLIAGVEVGSHDVVEFRP